MGLRTWYLYGRNREDSVRVRRFTIIKLGDVLEAMTPLSTDSSLRVPWALLLHTMCHLCSITD